MASSVLASLSSLEGGGAGQGLGEWVWAGFRVQGRLRLCGYGCLGGITRCKTNMQADPSPSSGPPPPPPPPTHTLIYKKRENPLKKT